MIDLILDFIAQVILIIAGSILYVFLTSRLLPAKLLKPKNKILYSSSIGIKKYVFDDGRGIVYIPDPHSQKYLTQYVLSENSGEKFDLVILDPPKLIDSRGALERGCRAYQYLARCGFNLLAPGGIMLNMSCSGQMSLELLQKITFAAALEAGRTAGIIDTVRQAADHPVSLSVPETFYLKGFITRAE